MANIAIAIPSGQSSARLVFTEDMRTVGATSPLDAANVSNWSVLSSLGTNTPESVIRLSNSEFELVFSQPIPVSETITIIVSPTVETLTGQKLLSNDTQMTIVEEDLSVVGYTFTNEKILVITLSTDVNLLGNNAVSIIQNSPNSRDIKVDDIERTSPTQITVTFNVAGTAGGQYTLLLDRTLIRTALNGMLVSQDEELIVFGQGSRPRLISLTIDESTASIISSEPFGSFDAKGFPDTKSAYFSTLGTLGNSLDTTTPDTLVVSKSVFTLGDTPEVGIRSSLSEIAAGVDLGTVADSIIGDGSSEVISGLSTLNKLAGSPYELVLFGTDGSHSQTPREIDLSIILSEPSTPQDQVVFSVTLLNTLTSVIAVRVGSLVTFDLYDTSLGIVSSGVYFNIDGNAISLKIVDSPDSDVIYAEVNGEIILGTVRSELRGVAHNIGSSNSNHSIALSLGHPDETLSTFSVGFTKPPKVTSLGVNGFYGSETNDLVDFSFLSLTNTVTAQLNSVVVNKLSASSSYSPDSDQVSVVIALDPSLKNFLDSGSCRLKNSQGSTIDELFFNVNHVHPETSEISVFFIHPLAIHGLTLEVSVSLNGVIYTTDMAVYETSESKTSVILSKQVDNAQPKYDQVVVTNWDVFGAGTILLNQ